MRFQGLLGWIVRTKVFCIVIFAIFFAGCYIVLLVVVRVSHWGVLDNCRCDIINF